MASQEISSQGRRQTHPRWLARSLTKQWVCYTYASVSHVCTDTHFRPNFFPLGIDFDIILLHCFQDAQWSRFSFEGANVNYGLLPCADICTGEFRVGSIDLASHSPPQHQPIGLPYRHSCFTVSAWAGVQARVTTPVRECSPAGGWSCRRCDGNTCCLSYPSARARSLKNVTRVLWVSNSYSHESKGEKQGRGGKSFREQAADR